MIINIIIREVLKKWLHSRPSTKPSRTPPRQAARNGPTSVWSLSASSPRNSAMTSWRSCGVIWPGRPLTWQKHCAQVLGWVRRGEAIEILMDMVGRGPKAVALDALELLSEFDPELLAPEQTGRIVKAIEALLARPLAPLHQLLLEKFLTALRSTGAAP